MQLRSSNNALEFVLQQKDEMIEKFRSDLANADKNTRIMDLGEENLVQRKQNSELEEQLNKVLLKNAELEEKVADLTVQVKKGGSGGGASEKELRENQAKLIQRCDSLIEDNR